MRKNLVLHLDITVMAEMVTLVMEKRNGELEAIGRNELEAKCSVNQD
jgi:hypothetical protein